MKTTGWEPGVPTAGAAQGGTQPSPLMTFMNIMVKHPR